MWLRNHHDQLQPRPCRRTLTRRTSSTSSPSSGSIYDIILHEKPEGRRAARNQTALKLAEKLERYGIKIMGTSYEALDLEDRGSFSTLLKNEGIPYPKFGVVDADQAVELSRELGFPLLVRPSYVLGGQRMKIVINEQDLERHVVDILRDMLTTRSC